MVFLVVVHPGLGLGLGLGLVRPVVRAAAGEVVLQGDADAERLEVGGLAAPGQEAAVLDQGAAEEQPWSVLLERDVEGVRAVERHVGQKWYGNLAAGVL